MATEGFETTSWGWQLQQLQQRTSQWWELQLSRIPFPDAPQLQIPQWGDGGTLLVWSIAIALGLWLLWRLSPLLLPYLSGWQSWRKGRKKTPPSVSENRPSRVWLERSLQFQRQGNYGEACRCLYMAMLRQLSDRGIVPYQLSRTDGEYRCLIQQQSTFSAYQTLLNAHEELCFNNTEITAEDYERCKQAYRRIEFPQN